jgi:hypothetical protein
MGGFLALALQEREPDGRCARNEVVRPESAYTAGHTSRGRSMKLLTPLLAVPVLALGLLACASPNPQQPTINKEDRLAAAGFKKRPIATEAQLADFRTIPAHMIRPSTYKGKPVYVYADPTICGCLYIGGTTAYNTYISGAMTRQSQAEYKSAHQISGYIPGPAMLDAGPWDTAEMYGLYLD